MRREHWAPLLLFAALLAAFGFVLLCLLAASARPARGDNRPSFALEYGECDEALQQWGRAALFEHFRAPVWQDAAETDRSIVVVVPVCTLFNVDDPELCMRLAVDKPAGWRAHRGDRAVIQWEPLRWRKGEDGRFKLVQLRTFVR